MTDSTSETPETDGGIPQPEPTEEWLTAREMDIGFYDIKIEVTLVDGSTVGLTATVRSDGSVLLTIGDQMIVVDSATIPALIRWASQAAAIQRGGTGLNEPAYSSQAGSVTIVAAGGAGGAGTTITFSMSVQDYYTSGDEGIYIFDATVQPATGPAYKVRIVSTPRNAPTVEGTRGHSCPDQDEHPYYKSRFKYAAALTTINSRGRYDCPWTNKLRGSQR